MSSHNASDGTESSRNIIRVPRNPVPPSNPCIVEAYIHGADDPAVPISELLVPPNAILFAKRIPQHTQSAKRRRLEHILHVKASSPGNEAGWEVVGVSYDGSLTPGQVSNCFMPSFSYFYSPHDCRYDNSQTLQAISRS